MVIVKYNSQNLLSANSRPTVCVMFEVKVWADCQPTVGDLLATCWQPVANVSHTCQLSWIIWESPMSPVCLNAPFETLFILKLLFYLELFDVLVHSLLQIWWLLKELFFLFPSLTNCKLYRSFVNKIAECLSFHNFSELPVELHALTKRTPKS